MALKSVVPTVKQEVDLVFVEPGADDAVEAPSHLCGFVEAGAPGVTVGPGADVFTCVAVNSDQRTAEFGLDYGQRVLERAKVTVVAINGERDRKRLREYRQRIQALDVWAFLYAWSEAVSTGSEDPQDAQWDLCSRPRPPRPTDEDTSAPEGD